MNPEEVVIMVNNSLESADPQSEDNLLQVAKAIAVIFQDKCGIVPNFDFVNSKGQIKLIKPEF